MAISMIPVTQDNIGILQAHFHEFKEIAVEAMKSPHFAVFESIPNKDRAMIVPEKTFHKYFEKTENGIIRRS